MATIPLEWICPHDSRFESVNLHVLLGDQILVGQDVKLQLVASLHTFIQLGLCLNQLAPDAPHHLWSAVLELDVSHLLRLLCWRFRPQRIFRRRLLKRDHLAGSGRLFTMFLRGSLTERALAFVVAA